LAGAGQNRSISLEIFPAVTWQTLMAVISVGMSPKCKPETCSSSTTTSAAVMRLAMVRFRPGLPANSFPYCSRITSLPATIGVPSKSTTEASSA